MAVSVETGPAHLTVRISGWDALWALSRGFTVPLDHVGDAAALRRDEIPRRFVLRTAGTALPRVVKAGRYGWRGHREFWATRWPERMLVISGAPGARYDLVVLETADPDGDAQMIRAALASAPTA